MRPLLLALAFCALAACLGACQQAAEPASRESVDVTRVADGDSLVVGGGTRVRLLQIDTPELGEGECYAREALRELKSLVRPGTRIGLERDERLDSADRHGRLLRYVHARALNVNVELVRRGAAAPFFLGGDRGRYVEELSSAVDEARSSRRGMWAACSVFWREDRLVETSRR
jgi:endonuclease YncB( thermonuclease family)